MLVLGAGPGGYSAAFRAADLGMKTIIVEQYAALGGVCLNVGCIPSKALLHTAAVMEEVKSLSKHGVSYPSPEVDLDKLREYKDSVIGRMTGGLAGMAKARKVDIIQGKGTFLDANHLQVKTTQSQSYDIGLDVTEQTTVIKFSQAIIAAGSQAVSLPFIPNSNRVIDSTGALKLEDIPERMLVIGGGIIGLEMATVYASLGSKIDIVEMMDDVMQGADPDLVKVWHKMNDHRFNQLLTKTKTVAVEERQDGMYVSFEAAAEGVTVPAEAVRYDKILVAVGRTPNGGKLSAENAGITVSDRGFITVDNQMRTDVSNIFAIGDIVGQPMLAHKAVHEAHVAAEAAHGEKSFFDVRQIPSVAYTDPEVAWAGVTELQAKAEGIAYEKSVFPWAASGRATANGRNEGFTKLLFDKETHQLIGGAIVGVSAGDMIGEICLAIEMGADPTDIGKTIHPHPTLGESIGMAAEVFEGVCTDLPPQRKR
jgi:dihydrolipoamide dehydrogenase